MKFTFCLKFSTVFKTSKLLFKKYFPLCLAMRITNFVDQSYYQVSVENPMWSKILQDLNFSFSLSLTLSPSLSLSLSLSLSRFIYILFFQTVIDSILLYRCNMWNLTKCMERKLNGNCTRMLWSVWNKCWWQNPTKQQLYGYIIVYYVIYFFQLVFIVVHKIHTIPYFSTNNFKYFTECPSELYTFSEKIPNFNLKFYTHN